CRLCRRRSHGPPLANRPPDGTLARDHQRARVLSLRPLGVGPGNSGLPVSGFEPGPISRRVTHILPQSDDTPPDRASLGPVPWMAARFADVPLATGDHRPPSQCRIVPPDPTAHTLVGLGRSTHGCGRPTGDDVWVSIVPARGLEASLPPGSVRRPDSIVCSWTRLKSRCRLGPH